jgi:hypothetical protein
MHASFHCLLTFMLSFTKPRRPLDLSRHCCGRSPRTSFASLCWCDSLPLSFVLLSHVAASSPRHVYVSHESSGIGRVFENIILSHNEGQRPHWSHQHGVRMFTGQLPGRVCHLVPLFVCFGRVSHSTVRVM